MLAGDLTSMRWKLVATGILIEAKDEIRKGLGRSPDRGDALAMAWATGVDRVPSYVPVGRLQNIVMSVTRPRKRDMDRSASEIVREFERAQMVSPARARPWRR